MSTLDSKIKQWSKTPAANGTAPNLVPYGWPEGMPPSAVNDVARQNMTDHRYQWEDAEWFARGEKSALSTPTGNELSKVSGTSFKLNFDATDAYHANRRIKIFDTTTKYATITSSEYSAPDTTVNLLFDNDASLGASFSAVALAILSAKNSSIPRTDSLSKNLIIGGNFDTNPWQRNVTFAAVANGQYTADRWRWTVTGPGVVTIQKNADAPTVSQAGIYSVNCLDVSTTTAEPGSVAATSQYTLQTILEGYNFAQIAHQPYTVSFWVKATVPGVYCFSVYSGSADAYYIAEYVVNASNVWEYKTVAVPASDPASGTWNYTNGSGLYLNWTIAAGSNFNGTANAWTYSAAKLCTANQVNGMNSNSNHFKIQLVQLESGTGSTAFEVDLVSEVLEKCMRYYEKSFDEGIYVSPWPGAVAGAQGNFMGAGTANLPNSSVVNYKVSKRTTPSLSIYSYIAGALNRVTECQNDGVTVQSTFTDNTIFNNGQNSFGISWVNSASPAYFGGRFQFISEAELS